MIGALAASGATLASTALAVPDTLDLATVKKDTDVACLYHCDFGDPQRFSAMLQNMNNHYSAYAFDSFKLELVMVVHSAGIKFFLDDLSGTPWEKETIDPDIYKRFVGLTKYGVRFTPTFQFFPESPEGLAQLAPEKREVARAPGYLRPDDFLALFRFVREKGYETKSFRDYLRAARS